MQGAGLYCLPADCPLLTILKIFTNIKVLKALGVSSI